MAEHSFANRLLTALALGVCITLTPACGDDDGDDQSEELPREDATTPIVRGPDGGSADAARDIDATSNIDAAGRIDAANEWSDSATQPSGGDAGDAAVDASAAAPGTKEYALGKLDPDMRTVIDALQALGARPVETLTVEQARAQPSIKEAVQKVLTDQGMSTAPEQVGTVVDIQIPGPDDTTLPIRVYRPAQGTPPFDAIVYFHGGGFVLATVDTYDASARALANATGAVVISVDYRRGPESTFPAAHDDAYVAYRWVLNNAEQVGAKANSVAVAGESAGGNLAANVVLRARGETGVPLPVHALLVYPIASNDLESASYVEYAEAIPLGKDALPWFADKYLTNTELSDGRINLVSQEFGGFSPTTIINAQVDPLRSDGDALFAKMKADNVNVQQRVYDGVTHEFFGTGAVVGDARAALEFAADRVKHDFKP